MRMRMRKNGVLVALVLLGTIAGSGCVFSTGTTTNTDKPLWTQVFTSWTCTAPGRPTWTWSARQLSDYEEKHEWTDGDTGTTERALVYENTVYLQKSGTSYRNLEYKIVQSQVLDHLEEASITADGESPYICKK
jgi:hypothetical protein